MSLERKVGTHNLSATLVTLSLQLWNLTGTARGQLIWSNKPAGGYYGFQETTFELAGKAKKPAAWHLMPHNKHLGKQGCNCQFRNHKIFNTRKYGMVTIQPSELFVFSASFFNCVHCRFICCCLSVLFVSLPVASIHIHSFDHLQSCFCFVRSTLFEYSVFNYSLIQGYFLSWYWNCIPGILIPISTTIRQVNKHHTQDCAIFCLSIGSESLLPS